MQTNQWRTRSVFFSFMIMCSDLHLVSHTPPIAPHSSHYCKVRCQATRRERGHVARWSLAQGACGYCITAPHRTGRHAATYHKPPSCSLGHPWHAPGAASARTARHSPPSPHAVHQCPDARSHRLPYSAQAGASKSAGSSAVRWHSPSAKSLPWGKARVASAGASWASPLGSELPAVQTK